MKKVLGLISTILLAVMLTSCLTVPKKVKRGDSLVIGQVGVRVLGAEAFSDIKFNGTFYDNIEIDVTNAKTNHSKMVKPNQKGYFFITGLKPHETYYISRIKMMRSGNGGTQWVEQSIGPMKSFIAYDNIVVNIGCNLFTFNYLSNEFTYEVRNFNAVKNNFLEAAEDSEWLDKDIVNQMQ